MLNYVIDFIKTNQLRFEQLVNGSVQNFSGKKSST